MFCQTWIQSFIFLVLINLLCKKIIEPQSYIYTSDSGVNNPISGIIKPISSINKPVSGMCKLVNGID